jgi:uncharacterized membrane protein YdjX (TVP38/TMEM64 family)
VREDLPTNPSPNEGHSPTGAARLRSIVAAVRGLGSFGPVAALALILPGLGGLVLVALLPTLAPLLREHLWWGLVIYSTGFIVLAGLAILPTYSLALLAGWAFGFGYGFPAALVGYMGGALVGYAVGRRSAQRHVVELLARHRKWDAVYRALLTGSPGRVILLIALVRLPPTFPFAALNLVLAAARVPPGRYLLGSFLGMAPRTVVTVWAAAQAARYLRDPTKLLEEGVWWHVLGGLAGAAVAVTVLTLIARRALKHLAPTSEAEPS